MRPLVRADQISALFNDRSQWAESLVAVDGHTTLDVPNQSRRVPKGTTHIALLVGGNDALNVIPRLRSECRDVISSLRILAEICHEFLRNYKEALDALEAHRLPLIV